VLRLERDLRRDLKQASIVGGGGDLAYGGARAEGADGIAVVRVVEEVERLATDLEPRPLINGERLRDGDVYIGVAGATQRERPHVAESAGGWVDEGRGVEPLRIVSGSSRIEVLVIAGNAGDNVRTVLADAAQGGVHTRGDAEGQPGAIGNVRAHLPCACNIIQRTVLERRRGDDTGDSNVVRDVEVTRTILVGKIVRILRDGRVISREILVREAFGVRVVSEQREVMRDLAIRSHDQPVVVGHAVVGECAEKAVVGARSGAARLLVQLVALGRVVSGGAGNTRRGNRCQRTARACNAGGGAGIEIVIVDRQVSPKMYRVGA
jgi:hypothetical protein